MNMIKPLARLSVQSTPPSLPGGCGRLVSFAYGMTASKENATQCHSTRSPRGSWLQNQDVSCVVGPRYPESYYGATAGLVCPSQRMSLDSLAAKSATKNSDWTLFFLVNPLRPNAGA